jgi:2-haloacid dehalogenase
MTQMNARAVAFDIYGTLFDFNPALAIPDLAPAAASNLHGLWRTKQLQYFWARTIQDAYRDFEAVTADALDFALDTLNLTEPALRRTLLDGFSRLVPYGDVVPSLHGLRAKGLRVVAYTNATARFASASLAGSGLADLFEEVISVDEIRLYKPHPAAYGHLVERLGVPRSEIVFVSSNGWDAYGAAQYGLIAAWTNRGRSPAERLPGQPAITIPDLSSLVPAVARAS